MRQILYFIVGIIFKFSFTNLYLREFFNFAGFVFDLDFCRSLHFLWAVCYKIIELRCLRF